MCKAADCSIVEVEEIVPLGALDPDQIHVSSIYVDRFYRGEYFEKPIAKLKLRDSENYGNSDGENFGSLDTKNRIARRAALELVSGSYVNLGAGIPLLVADHIPKGREVHFHSENGIFGMGPYPLKVSLSL